MDSAYPLREPCRHCGCVTGWLETRNGQDCVFCEKCRRLCYNAPKTETGRSPRTVTTVHNGIKSACRARIILRATGRCELCGATGNLHVGHLLPVKEGLAAGLTELDLNSDENLAAMCDECNLGIGAEVVPLRLVVAIIRRRLH